MWSAATEISVTPGIARVKRSFAVRPTPTDGTGAAIVQNRSPTSAIALTFTT